MTKHILQHYKNFSQFTYPGPGLESILCALPDDIRQLGQLVRSQIIHRVRLNDYRSASIGREDGIPWFRQPEDAIFPTASSILAELYRRDSRGLTLDRMDKDKLVLTCRPVAILMSSILKSKGIPARVRSGFVSYLPGYGEKIVDHWVVQYWDMQSQLWRTIDVDGSDVIKDFDPFNLPPGRFEFAADVWMDSREGRSDPSRYWNASGESSLRIIAWEVFYDFHCLMNSEIIYPHHPRIAFSQEFPDLDSRKLDPVDGLARLLQDCDENFDELQGVWQTNREFRLLKGVLLYDT